MLFDKEKFVLELQDKIKVFDDIMEAEWLAMTIFGEARGNCELLKEHVGICIMTRRIKNGWYGKTIRDVVTKSYQFSCYNPDDPNFEKLQHPLKHEKYKTWFDCYSTAQFCISKYQDFSDLIDHGITHYESIRDKDKRPKWTMEYQFVTEIEDTRFYRAEKL